MLKWHDDWKKKQFSLLSHPSSLSLPLCLPLSLSFSYLLFPVHQKALTLVHLCPFCIRLLLIIFSSYPSSRNFHSSNTQIIISSSLSTPCFSSSSVLEGTSGQDSFFMNLLFQVFFFSSFTNKESEILFLSTEKVNAINETPCDYSDSKWVPL